VFRAGARSLRAGRLVARLERVERGARGLVVLRSARFDRVAQLAGGRLAVLARLAEELLRPAEIPMDVVAGGVHLTEREARDAAPPLAREVPEDARARGVLADPVAALERLGEVLAGRGKAAVARLLVEGRRARRI